jgi:hypothetical protein
MCTAWTPVRPGAITPLKTSTNRSGTCVPSTEEESEEERSGSSSSDPTFHSTLLTILHHLAASSKVFNIICGRPASNNGRGIYPQSHGYGADVGPSFQSQEGHLHKSWQNTKLEFAYPLCLLLEALFGESGSESPSKGQIRIGTGRYIYFAWDLEENQD